MNAFHRYRILRVIRHFMPEDLTRFLLRRGWIIKPGLETYQPLQAVNRYRQVLEANGCSIQNKRVLIFGYGGHFAVGMELLRQGAAHIVLADKFALPDDRRNYQLLQESEDYLFIENALVRPNPTYITLLSCDIQNAEIEPVDIILSSSVYEHLPSGNIDGITQALATLMAEGGCQLHFIDLRDHYFKLPFEMLTYPEKTWSRWLNPTSNLNRFRFNDYKILFERHFQCVEITVLERDLAAFEQNKARLRPEFLTGDPELDAITQIRVLAA